MPEPLTLRERQSISSIDSGKLDVFEVVKELESACRSLLELPSISSLTLTGSDGAKEKEHEVKFERKKKTSIKTLKFK